MKGIPFVQLDRPMMTRDLVMPLFVAGAFGLPFLLSNAGNENAATQQNAGSWNYNAAAGAFPGQGQVTTSPLGNGTWILPGDANGPDLSAAPLEFMPINDLAQVFRLDLTVQEIRSRFPGISLVTSETGAQGYRTELITGTGTHDLHGCVTWYYDTSHKMQRLSFRGWTGDHQQLKNFLSSQFLLSENKSTRWTEMMTLESWGKKSCAAIFQLPAIVRQQTPQQQIAVLIEINRSSSQELSPAVREAASF
jgi:hypothetical protein